MGVIWRYDMRYKLLIVFASIFLLSGIVYAQEAKKDGWWIKVIPQKPEPEMIVFYIGPNSHSYGVWKFWSPGQPVEFDVSDEHRNREKLFIKAQTTSGVKCRFCMMYKNKGVKHFEFDIEEDFEANQTDEDKKCK
jgi:hypothetical protein